MPAFDEACVAQIRVFGCFGVDMSYDQTNLLFIAEENTAIPGENCKLPEFSTWRKSSQF